MPKHSFGEHRQKPVIAEKLDAVRALEAEAREQVRIHTGHKTPLDSRWLLIHCSPGPKQPQH